MRRIIARAGARIAHGPRGGAGRGRALLCALVSVIAICPQPGGAAAQDAPPDPATALGALQRDDARLQAIGWRLATANARFCAGARPAVGLLLQDAMNYDDPDAIRAALGFSGDIAVEAVAPASPAAQAGLVPNDEILAIDGAPMAALPAVSAGDYTRLDGLHDRIEASLARNGHVALRLRKRGGEEHEVDLAGVAACPGRFALRAGGRAAQADGTRVLIGQRFGAGDRPAEALQEGEFVAVVAHELAHNLLGHGHRPDDAGRGWDELRKAEREADRLGAWLLANAGYDPGAAPQLMRGWGRRNDNGLLRLPTHEGWEERAAAIEAEITRVRESIARRGAADWRRDFVRE